MLDANAIPGAVIGLITAAVMVYQARIGMRPAERAGFRDDFEAMVDRLTDQNDRLEAKVGQLESKLDEANTKLDEAQGELRAFGRYTRSLTRRLLEHDIEVPAYVPPPDLSKHLN